MHDHIKVAGRLRTCLDAAGIPVPEAMIAVISGPTGVSTAGFPYIARRAFRHFLDQVPHLAAAGQALIDWLAAVESVKESLNLGPAEAHHLATSITVIRNVVKTAAVTAPPDLWIVRHVLAAHTAAGVTAHLAAGGAIDDGWCGAQGLDAGHLAVDCALLVSRGFLVRDGEEFRLNPGAPQVSALYQWLLGQPPAVPDNMVPPLRLALGPDGGRHAALAGVGGFLKEPLPRPSQRGIAWIADARDLETGFRLVPVVLALQANGQAAGLKAGGSVDAITERLEGLGGLLAAAGMIDNQNRLTVVGERVLSRGPGPFGIIHAYYPYMASLGAILRGKKAPSHVARGENVAASQDANRKTFRMANDALDRFCARHDFTYRVFIEHAVGRGEATRQRHLKDKDGRLAYVGADLEDAAIAAAEASQRAGELPAAMKFIRRADIGRPAVLLSGLSRLGLEPRDAVMVVGNGFHEIRRQSNEQMTEVFKEYCAAGIILIFTEESGLSDTDLLATGWNTYHAGFRYVHELSGQGLRPATDAEGAAHGRFSWEKCARLGGYEVLQEYTSRTRTIYPHPGPDGHNPAISVTYFCVPGLLWKRLSGQSNS